MWRGAELERMVPLLQEHANVSEIIIIDNDGSFRPNYITEFSKVRILEFGFNCFVNPSWNIGVSEAKEEFVCIMNDDVLFSPEIFDKIGPLLQEYPSPIGPSKRVLNKSLRPQKSDIPWMGPLHIETPEKLPYGWGMCMFLRKSQFKPIPVSFLIYYGDAWIAEWAKMNNQKPRTIAMNLLTRESSTSGASWESDIGRMDHKASKTIIQTLNEPAADWNKDRQRLLEYVKNQSIENPVTYTYYLPDTANPFKFKQEA